MLTRAAAARGRGGERRRGVVGPADHERKSGVEREWEKGRVCGVASRRSHRAPIETSLSCSLPSFQNATRSERLATTPESFMSPSQRSAGGGSQRWCRETTEKSDERRGGQTEGTAGDAWPFEGATRNIEVGVSWESHKDEDERRRERRREKRET